MLRGTDTKLWANERRGRAAKAASERMVLLMFIYGRNLVIDWLLMVIDGY